MGIHEKIPLEEEPDKWIRQKIQISHRIVSDKLDILIYNTWIWQILKIQLKILTEYVRCVKPKLLCKDI